MAKDDEKDQPSDEAKRRDDLAQKRAAKESEAAASGQSIDDLAAGGGGDPEPEMFPLGTLDGDPKKTLKNLLKTGLPVEVTASIRSAEVPCSGGLLDPDENGRVMVSYVVEKVETVIIRHPGPEKRIKGYKLRQVLGPTYVEAVKQQLPASGTGG